MKRNNGQTASPDKRFATPKILDSVPVLIACVDRNQRYSYANSTTLQWLGLSHDEMIGRPVAEVLGEDAYGIVRPYMEKALAGQRVQFQYCFHRRGDARWADVTYTPYFDPDGQVTGYVVNTADITESHNAQLQLRDFVDNAPMALHGVDENGILLWANQAELDLVGYSREEYVGRHVSALHVNPDIIESLLERLRRNAPVEQVESVIRRKDGGLRHVVLTANALRDNGRFVHTRCFTLDVTETRKATNRLRFTELRYRQLLEALPIAVYTCDAAGHVRFFNKAAEDLWGRKARIGKDKWSGAWRILDEGLEPLTHDNAPMAVAIQQARPVFGENLIVERPDGTRRYIIPYPQPLFDEEGRVSGAINAVADVTPQRLAEQAVKTSETLYRQLVSNLPVPLYTCDPEGKILIYNKAAAGLWNREPVAGRDAWWQGWKLYNTDGSPMPRQRSPMALGLAEQRSVIGDEIIIERPDGMRRYVAPYVHPLRDAAGRFAGSVNLLMDVTDHRRAMKALVESEERFKTVASHAPVVIWMTDRQGNLVYVNQQWTALTGEPLQRALGKGWFELLHPDDRDRAREDATTALNERRHYQSQFRVRGANGGFLVARSTGSPRHTPEGRFTGYIGILQDITLEEDALLALEREIQKRTLDLSRNNEELRRSEERYHRMVAEVQDYAIFRLDSHGIIENWNAGAEKIKGYRAEEVVGKHFRMFYSPPDQQDGLPERLLSIAAKTGRASHEGWRVRKNGQRFWANTVLTALHDEHQQVTGFSKVTRDLTEIKEAEDALRAYAQQLEDKNRELQKINKELGSFAYVSSHDLQEPLRKIQAFSSRLVEMEYSNMSDKGRDYFNRILKSAERMRMLIEDLLAYSHTSTATREPESVDLNTLVSEITSEFHEALESQHAVIHADPLPVVRGIRFQLHQLMTNLISNALKFVRADTRPEITITATRIEAGDMPGSSGDHRTPYHRISVRDNGIGFAAEFADRIFEIFQRLHSRGEYEGTGVGLAICKKIVENHGGFIVAEGQPQVGATFHVYLPATT